MKNLYNIKEKFTDKKITKKCLALLLAFSMTVGFVMPYEEVFESTIKTAFAAGQENAVENVDLIGGRTVPAGNIITEAYDHKPDGVTEAFDFGKHLDNNNCTLEVTTTDGGSGASVPASITLRYKFESNPGLKAETANRYLYYQLPDGIRPQYAIKGVEAFVSDTNWKTDKSSPDTGKIPGWYSISTDGLIVIKLTDFYIEDKIKDGAFEGGITFNGTLGRDGTATGDKTYTIGGKEIRVTFDDVIKENSKQSRITTNDAGDMVIHYTITVNNPAQNVDFTQYNFTDKLINSGNAQNGKITNVVSNPTDCINYDDNGNVTFTDSAKNQTSFTIEYDYKPDDEEINGKLIENDATIVNKTDENDKAKTKKETEIPPESLKANITKNGTPSYLATEDSTTGYIEWTINVKRDYNLSLKDYVITDNAFSGINVPVSEGSNVKKAEIISVKDKKSGNDVSYSHNANSNDIKINQDTDDVIITYRTYVDDNGALLKGNQDETDVNNTASVTPPPEEPGGNPPPPDDDDSEKVRYSESSSIEKTGSSIEIDGYDKLNKPESIPVELEWTVRISDFGEIKGGKTFTDTLKNAPEKQWFTYKQIEAIKASLSSKGLAENDDYNLTLTGEYDKYTGFTINFLQGIKDNHIKKLELVYHSKAETKDIDFNSSATFKNTGTYDNSDEEEVTVRRKNDPYSGVGTTEYTGRKFWNDSNNPNRPKAYFMLQYRVDGSNDWKKYPEIDGITNPMEAGDYTHWSNLPKSKPAMNGEEAKDYYYRIIEVVPDGNGGYTEGTPDGYTVSYSIAYTNDSYDINTGFHANTEGYKTLDITNTYAYFDATVNKYWQNAPDNHPTKVEFTLYESTDETNWTKVTNVTPTQNGDSYTFSNLPRKTADGKTIYYKVEEVSIPDYTVSYPTNSISETNTSWTVTNTYDKMAINAIKNWVGDAGSESSRPNSITVHLESTQTPNDANSWQTVADSSQTLNENNEWKYTWSELPRKDSNNNPIYYRIREDANQSPEYEANYEKQYISDPNSYDEDFVINNVWKKVNITPQKEWVGDTPSDRTETLEFKLQYKAEANGEWKDHTESNDNVINNASNITINVDRSNDADNIDTAVSSWKNLPREVDEVKYYYRAVEVSVPNGYVKTYDENGLNQTGNSVITNTFDSIEITPAKKWNGDEGHESDRGESVQFKLQWKYEGDDSSWNDTTINDVAPVGKKDTITINKQDVSEWTTDNKWSKLPKTNEVGGERKNILYQVVEVTENENYTASPSTITNVSNTLTVTNTYNFIKITASKEWAKDTSSDRPATIKVHLEQSTDNGTTWTTVEDSEQTFNVTGDSISLTYEKWNKLPKEIVDGGTTKTIYYRVVEDSVTGYSASYSPETISGNSGTIAITNTKKEEYSKTAIDPTATIADGTKISDLTEITTISAKDLKNVPVDNDNYVFIWKVTIPNKEYVKYIDTLPENASFYSGLASSNIYVDYSGQIYQNGDNVVCTVNNDNTVTFDYKSDSGAVTGFVYYTKVPKSIVDDEVAKNGYYELSNNIKREGDEDDGVTANLIIGSKTDVPGTKGNITKSYDSSNLFNDRLTADARYEIIVNPDGKDLSNDDYIDLSDLFEVTGYKEPDKTHKDNNGNTVIDQVGAKHTGSNLLDAVIHDIQVVDMNTGQKITDYSYIPEYNKETEETFETPHTFSKYNGNVNVWRDNVKPGEKITLTITSSASNETSYDWAGRCYYKTSANVDVVEYAIPEFTTDSDGIATIEFTVPYDKKDNVEIGILEFNFYSTNGAMYGKITGIAGTGTQTVKTVNSAAMSFQVPDETPLRITYCYSLTVNDNTPGKDASGNDLNIGDKPPAGSEVFFKNEASINTSDGSETSETDETSFKILDSSADISTGNIPSIEKVDIGNYAINNLNATFKLAKYNTADKNWVYATSFTSDDEGIIQIGYGVDAENKVEKLEVSGNTKINLAPNTLYKLVEVTSPTGYVQVNNENKDDFVFYFVYGNLSTDDINAAAVEQNKIMQISTGETIQIPNIKLINISVSKTWTPVPENPSDVISTFRIYYSTKRSSTIPPRDDLKEISSLGITDSDTKEMKFKSDGTQENTPIWTNLPNGKDGKPIYYYVVEESYEINGKKYERQADGTYKTENGENGDYKSLYSGNALSKDGTVKVTNTKGLYVRKEWKNSDGTSMANAPVESIQFLLEGKTSAGAWETIKCDANTELWTLNKPDWQLLIPDDKLTNYVDFRVTEKLTQEQGVTLYGYVVSYTKNLNGTSGVMNISNKNPFANEIDFIVNKKWADGLPADEHSGVEVTLYRATIAWAGYTPTDAERTSSEALYTVTLNASNSWSYRWEGLDNLQNNGQRYYYYAVETVLAGYTASYEKTGVNTQRETITNTPKAVEGKLSVQKKWEKVSDSNQEDITLNLYRRKKASTTETYNIPSSVKVTCIGDSITSGSINGLSESVRYFSRLKEKLQANSTSVIVEDKGVDGNKINDIKTRIDGTATNNYKIVESLAGVDVVCLLAGTNDTTSYNANMDSDLDSLIKAIFEKASSNNNTNLKIYVGTIPYIDIKCNYFGHSSKYSGNPNQSQANALVDSTNNIIRDKVESLKSTGYNVELVDINSVVDVIDANGNALSGDKTMLEDGCHPNAKGYEAIAQAFYIAIGRGYGVKQQAVTGNNVPTDIDYVPTDFTDEELVETFTLSSGHWTKSWEKLPTTGTDKNGITYEYIYYVEEVNADSSWKVSYQHNGQPANGQMTITVTNTGEEEIEKLPISVKKVWKDSDNKATDVHPDSVTVQLYFALSADGNYTPVSGTEVTLNSGNNWTHEWQVEKGLYYKVVETKIDGWEAESTTVYLENETSPNTITLTNTLETGSLQIDKSWRGNANVDSVQVELYRVAVDENGNPITEQSETSAENNSTFSLNSGLFSLSRFNRAVAELEAQNSEQEAPQAEIEETTVSKTKASLSPMKSTASAKTTSNPFVSLPINLSSGNKTFAVPDLSGKTITSVSAVMTNEGGYFQFYFDFYDGDGSNMWDNYKDAYIGSTDTEYVATFDIEVSTRKNVYVELKQGTATVEEIRFYYQPQGPSIRWDGTDKTTLTANVTEGSTVTLPVATATNGTLSYSWNETDGITINGNEVTFNNFGTYIYTATVTDSTNPKNTISITSTYNVTARDFSLSPNTVTLHPNGTATLSAGNLTGITWESSNGAVATVDNTGRVTAVGDGTATITATRNGKTATAEIEVVTMRIKHGGNEHVSALTIDKNIDESETIEFVGAIGNVTGKSADTSVATVDGTTIKVTDKEKASTTVTFTDDAGASITVTVNINEAQKVEVKLPANAKLVNSVGANGVITISEKNDWTATIENLPTTDGKGHYYQYYIKEVKNDKYIPVSYSNNGTHLVAHHNPTKIEVVNKPEETSEGVELPETGGIGTKPYTVIGLSFMSISAAIMFIRRRRRMIKRS